MARATTTSDVFNAIAEPRRRQIVMYLRHGERPVGDVARALRMSQPSVSKHLGVLRQVKLVRRRREGRTIFYSTDGAALKPVFDWVGEFERYWARQLDHIKRIAEEEDSRRSTGIASPPKD